MVLPDGNGRTGRLVLNLMLMQSGYPSIDVKFVDRKRYYACFDSYYKDKTATPMVAMVAEYLENTVLVLMKTILKIMFSALIGFAVAWLLTPCSDYAVHDVVFIPCT